MLLEVSEWVFMDISIKNKFWIPKREEVINERGSFLFRWRDDRQRNSSCRQI